MTQTKPQDHYIDAGIQVHLRSWMPNQPAAGRKQPVLLLHGLSSNAQTWNQVSARLAAAGHQVAAVDQRGHGLSDKPDNGYDFNTITHDLSRIIDQLDWNRPMLVGQSWGGNVLLEYAARYPGTAAGYVFVDGGFLDLSERGPWGKIKAELRPPDLSGMPKKTISDRIRQMHPNWTEEGIEGTLGNFEILPDQTIRPWLTMDRHMAILRAMYEQNPKTLFPLIKDQVMICAAEEGNERFAFKQNQVMAAADSLENAEVIWFLDSAHDIHVDQPDKLASVILSFMEKL
jgi:pimeloyl-ACP methyl ester carboxylesterase